MEDLNNLVDEDLEQEVMEMVRRRANRVLAGPDYEDMMEEAKNQTRTSLITAWLPQAIDKAKEEREESRQSRRSSRMPREQGLSVDDLRRAIQEV